MYTQAPIRSTVASQTRPHRARTLQFMEHRVVWSVAEASKAATRQADKAAAQQGDRTSNTSKDVNLLLFTWNVACASNLRCSRPRHRPGGMVAVFH